MMALSTLSVALILSICSCFNTAQAVSVTLDPPTPAAIIRGSFLLTCTAEIADGTTVQDFKWYHNQTEITDDVILQSNYRFNIRRSGNVSFLLVTSSERQDGGEYYCEAILSGSTNSVNSSRHIIRIRGIYSVTTDEAVYEVVLNSRVEIRCIVDADPPPDSITWRRVESANFYSVQYREESGFGVLQKTVTLEDNGDWICHVSGELGGLDGMFVIEVLDVPAPPSNFCIEEHPNDTQAIIITWTKSVQNGPVYEVEDYVVEQSINGGEFQLTDYVFDKNATSGGLSGLPPGVTYVFRLRARNLAGLSLPSNNVTYDPPPIYPLLSFFNVSALEGGRSVLLEWELAFDGGHKVTNFIVEIILFNDKIHAISLNVSLGNYVVTGLRHDTHYEFRAMLVNAAGWTASFASGTSTTVAPPSQPSRPSIMSKTTSSIKISFSVEFGTEPITHFLLNITGTISETEMQKRFPISAIKYIDSLEDIVDYRGDVIGYNVEIVVTGLKLRELYQFEVAAESSIGVGEFSEPLKNILLEVENDYTLCFIIGGVLGGMLLIVIPICVAVMALSCCRKQHYQKRKKILAQGTKEEQVLKMMANAPPISPQSIVPPYDS